MKKTIIVLTFLVFQISVCYSQSKNINELIFKNWLRDTINVLNRGNHLDYKRKITINADSLSIDIVKTFNNKIHPKNIHKIKHKELIYAMDLLIRNNDLPQDEFRLKFCISSDYSVSMVEQLKYEYNSEIMLFVIIEKNRIIKYTFSKGNFIEKKILENQ
jgi:hypothetical protein